MTGAPEELSGEPVGGGDSAARAGGSLARAMSEEALRRPSWGGPADDKPALRSLAPAEAAATAHEANVRRVVLGEVKRQVQLIGRTLAAGVGSFLQAHYAELSKLDRSSAAELTKKATEKVLATVGDKLLPKFGESLGGALAKVLGPAIERLFNEQHARTRATLGMTQQMLSMGQALERFEPRAGGALRQLINELDGQTAGKADWHQGVLDGVRAAFPAPAPRDVLAAVAEGYLELKYKEKPLDFVLKHGNGVYRADFDPAAARRREAFELADRILGQ